MGGKKLSLNTLRSMLTPSKPEMGQAIDKTAATWRNEGKIGFSQEGKKIYYRMSDIEAFLERFHKKPFAAKPKSI